MRKAIATTVGVALGVALAAAGTVALAARNSSGTYSNTAPTFVSGTAINSSVFNTQFADYAAALTDSVSRSGKGGFQAPAQCVDGVAGLPGLTFGLEPTTGFYRIGTNDVGLSIGGVKRWEHTAAGQIETGWAQFAGTVTIGGVLTITASPVWTTISPTAGWTNGSGDQALAYRKDAYGVVYLRGRITNTAGSASTTVVTLPAGFQPPAIRGAMVFGFSAAAAIGTTIDTSGNVQMQSAGGAGNIFYMDSVSFSTQ
jgi:hypothetical protein